MSLYRTYRPQKFADVVGQEHVVTTLEQAAKQDKLAHAYLFAGGRGTGKTSVARILAKVIMSRGVDESIREQVNKGVEDASIVDLLEIDAASNRGIDDVRDLIEKIQFSPVVAGAKVYIIDEVHMLTKEAFNALLKTLEEPPPYAYFILCTTELNKIPTTIQSRCQCFPFRQIREEDIIRRLQFIADTEKISADREALRAIAGHVQGGLRDAISLLDQLRSLKSIGLEDVRQRIGSTGYEHVQSIFESINEKDTKKLIATVRALEESGVPMDVFLRQFLTVIRDQIHAAVEADQPTDQLLWILDTLLDAIRDVRSAPVPGLVVESALLTIAERGNAGTSVLPELTVKEEESNKDKNEDGGKGEDKDEDRNKGGKKSEENSEETKKQEESKAENQEKDLSEALVEVADLSIDSIKKSWTDIVKKTTPASVRMSLKDGRAEKLDGDTLTICFTSAFHKDKVSATDASLAVENVIEELFKKSIRLECVVEEPDSTAAEADQKDVSLAEAAAEIF